MRLSCWGNFPIVDVKKYVVRSKDRLKDILLNVSELSLYGNGRSYGDCALNNNVVDMKLYDNFLDFHEESSVLHVQAGVLLVDIIDSFIEKGWFLKITPGTKLITIGGAIAADVHGKNHHVEGCFSESVLEFNIMLADGNIVNVKKGEELFYATCGGMGLTGVILDAKIELKRIGSAYIVQETIKTNNLKETFEAFELNKHKPYSVAWIDCLAKGESIGRSLLMAGDFDSDQNYIVDKKRGLSIPFMFPSFLLNFYTVKIFNWLYYSKASSGTSTQRVDYNQFFYPLDAIGNWNKIYGKKGFVQYQFILPKEYSYSGLMEILSTISMSGKGSFLAVLKLYGKENGNYLSFPIEGYSLALDFKIEDGVFDLLNKLDDLVNRYKGRIYLAKDARISKENFECGYPHIENFRKFRKHNKMDVKFNSLQSKRLDI